MHSKKILKEEEKEKALIELYEHQDPGKTTKEYGVKLKTAQTWLRRYQRAQVLRRKRIENFLYSEPKSLPILIQGQIKNF